MFPDLTRDDVFRLETRRLWLRWPNAADAAALVRFAGDRAVAEMTSSIPHPFPPEEATAFVLRSRQNNTMGASLTMAITPRAKPADLIGVVTIVPSPDGPSPQFGCWIAPPCWNQGFATEAARTLVDAFFAYADGTELTAWTRVTNPASGRVLEKCGFKPVGSGVQAMPARGGAHPVHRFGLNRQRWQGLRNASGAGFVQNRRADEVAAAL